MVKRAWCISDIHWGCRSNTIEWLEIVRDYHKEFLIPHLKKNKKEGDILYISGDIFDSRQSIGLNALNMALECYDEISKIMPIYMILGNHDIFNKSTNEVNSVKPLKYLNNVFVYEEPEFVKWGGKDILLMPWRKDHQTEKEFLTGKKADYLLCHTDFVGAKNNAVTKVEHGNGIDLVKDIKKVYSGHIHWTQKIGNVTFFGSPYQMTRSDIGNTKKLWLLDFENDTEEIIYNNYSPSFIKMHIKDLLNMSPMVANRAFANNFVDLQIPNKLLDIIEVKDLHYWLSDYRRLTIQTLSDDLVELEEGELEKSTSILDTINEYIKKKEYSDKIKSLAYTKILDLFSKVENGKNVDNN